MNTILFFQSTTRSSWLKKLSGIHRFAQGKDWFVQVIERHATVADIRQALETWRPAGCLVDRAMTLARPPDHIFKGIPTVYLDQNPANPSREHPCLLHDSAASAALALKELMERDCRSHAYLGTGKAFHWDVARLERVKADVAAAGLPFAVLYRKSMMDVLKALPKPCGILGANDYCAMEAYHAAANGGFAIPDEVMIAGIDNDERYCEAVSPGITSVEPDFEGAGWILGKMLAREMDGDGSVRTETYGPMRLVRRGSTAKGTGISLAVRRAGEYIRRHACEANLSIDAVASAMGCSRSLATSRFRNEAGHTILDEIHDQRFQKMCELLSRGAMPISMVVRLSGYESDGFAKRLFRKRAGMTMREWRNKSRVPNGCAG